jgi:predicted nuclease of restriction endonuclease-like (RecB) superfamily
MSETPAIYANTIHEIKSAILRSRYRAATLANRELLVLYFSVGGYISANSRKGKWGTNAIETISAQLQKELPGLRGFSATNMKNMRLFHEEWALYIQLSEQLDSGYVEIRQLPTADKLPDALGHGKTNRQLPTADLDYTAFFRVGFTQHREILRHCPSREERLFYIARCAAEFWSVEALKSNLRGNLFVRAGAMPLPDAQLAEIQGKINLANTVRQISEAQFRLLTWSYIQRVMREDTRIASLPAEEIVQFETGRIPGFLNLTTLTNHFEILNARGSMEQRIFYVVVEYTMSRSLSPAQLAEYKRLLIPEEALQYSLEAFSRFLGTKNFITKRKNDY